MKKFTIKYKCGNQIVTSNELENSFYSLDVTDTKERFTVILNPKKTFVFYIATIHRHKKSPALSNRGNYL